ncbi:COG0613 Predicted metal-dependent phosphoesterases (PHP family) [Candidatus Nanopelagicaceae bacterium]
MIDLHTHTTYSDGTDSPLALVKKAAASGITVLGVTDHDSTSGWGEAISALHGNLQLALGAEVSCLTEDGVSVHMLGLLFDGENQPLQQLLSDSRDTRIPRMKKMIENLQAAGYEITLNDVQASTPPGATVGRPHLADALVARNIVKSRDEAFTDLLHNDSPFYVSHFAPTPEDSIRAIRAAGGVAVIAHPFASRRGQVLSAHSFQSLVEAGLNGIEVFHRDQSEDERAQLIAIASELNLVVTGSSDYHGTGKLNKLGENTTTQAEWERLESMANQRRVLSR